MTLKERLALLKRSSFFSDILKLMSGTLGGRIIVLATLPLATRLYAPDDFALLAAHLSLINIFAVGACLRFDIAIPVATNKEDAANLLILSILIASLIAGLGLAAVTIAPVTLAHLAGQPRLAPWLWLVPLGVLLSATYAALQSWATRARRFGSIAVTRVTQALVGNATMLTLGLAGIAPLGLLLGNMLTAGAGSIRLGVEAAKQDGSVFLGLSRKGLYSTFRAYRRYPTYSVPDAMLNIAGIQVPVLIVASLGGNEAGFLLLAQLVMNAPLALMGSAISQVYVSRAPEEMRKGLLAEFTLGVLRRLARTGVIPLVLLSLLAPVAFDLVFGAQWSHTGDIIGWMVPWNIMQFLASPISTIMYVAGRQRMMLALTMFGSALRIGGTLIAANLYEGATVLTFVSLSALFYGVCLVVFCRAARISLMSIKKDLLMFVVAPLLVYLTIHLVEYGGRVA